MRHEEATSLPPQSPEQDAETAREMDILHEEYLREQALISPASLMRKLETLLPGSTAGLPVGGLRLRRRA